MSIRTTPAADATESAMLVALASILSRGTFVADELDALVTAENDITADDGARRFARHAIEWLGQQSAQRELSVFNPTFDARH